MANKQQKGSSWRRGGDRSQKHDVSYLLNESATGSSVAGSSGREPHPARPKRIPCPLCGQSFTQAADLRKHTRTVHEGLRPYTCDVCNKSFGEKGNLSKHRRSVHFNERPFSCSICGAAFAFRDGLVRHVKLVHDGARPFVCNRCGTSYKQVSQLRRHQMSCSSGGSGR